MLTVETWLVFVDEALDEMETMVASLGDDLANRAPLPTMNTPYALLTHCLGVVEQWAGNQVAGREIERDRDAEFTASGPVGPLLARAHEVRAQLARDAATAELAAPLRIPSSDPED